MALMTLSVLMLKFRKVVMVSPSTEGMACYSNQFLLLWNLQILHSF